MKRRHLYDSRFTYFRKLGTALVAGYAFSLAVLVAVATLVDGSGAPLLRHPAFWTSALIWCGAASLWGSQGLLFKGFMNRLPLLLGHDHHPAVTHDGRHDTAVTPAIQPKRSGIEFK